MKNSLIHRAPPSGGHDTNTLPAKQSIMRRVLFVSAILLSAMLPVRGAVPNAQEILASTRLRVSQQDIDVQGQLRENGRVVPFRLTQTGPVIRYSFSNPSEALQLRLGANDANLEQLSKEGVDKISGPEFEQKVRGTAITFEDLSLKFLYWRNARVIGEDSVSTRRCWKIELLPPNQQSQYSRVIVWCDEEGGALMKMEGYDEKGRLVRRFQVVSAQKIEGRWFLKEMRIEQLDPQTSRTVATTYLDIKKSA